MLLHTFSTGSSGLISKGQVRRRACMQGSHSTAAHLGIMGERRVHDMALPSPMRAQCHVK